MRQVKFICILLLTVVFSQSIVCAQDVDMLPSLWKDFRHAKHDTTRIGLYHKIGEIFDNSNPDSAIFFYSKALILAEKSSLNRDCSEGVFNRLQLLKAISLRYIGIVLMRKGDYEKAIPNYRKALTIYSNLASFDDEVVSRNAKFGMADCQYNIGKVQYYTGDFDSSIGSTEASARIFKEMSLSSPEAIKAIAQKGMAKCHASIGMVNADQGVYSDAVSCYLKSLKIFELLEDKRGIAMCYNALGNVYSDQKQYRKSIDYYEKTLVETKELNNNIGVARVLNNIGIGYKNLGAICKNSLEKNHYFGNAIKYFTNALVIAQEVGDKKTISACYNSLGNTYGFIGEHDLSLRFFLKSLALAEEMGDKNAIASLDCDIAKIHYTMADSMRVRKVPGQRLHLNKSIEFGKRALVLAQEIKSMPIENEAASILKDAYRTIGNTKEAFRYAEIYITTTDSMFSANETKVLAEMEAQYNTAKQKLEIEKLNKEQELQLAQNQKQRVTIYSTLTIVILLLLFGLYITNRIRVIANQKRIIEVQRDEVKEKHTILNQQNEEILAQRDEIEAQRDEIEAQRDLVIDQKERIQCILTEVNESITYAQLIQAAILPDNQLLLEHFDSHFLLYKPKNVVSGDFYWWAKQEDILIVAVADCTGHGVPGGFMSMLGSSLLREIVQKEYITHPGVILRKLRKEVVKALKQKGVNEIQRDGLDIALISFDTKSKLLQYAGAQMPLIIARKQADSRENSLTIVKGDKMPIGIYERMDPFVNHEIELQSGDCLYMFTDGFVDQFGGPVKKKFSSKRLRAVLENIYHHPMNEQCELLNTTIEGWKAENSNDSDQTDDITILGIRVV